MISARPGQATGRRSAVPSILSGVRTTRVPVPSSVTPPFTGPIRSFGPGTSWSTAISRPACSDATRIIFTVSACSSGVSCAKFSRATSIPARIIRSSTSREREAGPMVATIFVERNSNSSNSVTIRPFQLVQIWTNWTGP